MKNCRLGKEAGGRRSRLILEGLNLDIFLIC
jgi:hypothetical protein